MNELERMARGMGELHAEVTSNLIDAAEERIEEARATKNNEKRMRLIGEVDGIQLALREINRFVLDFISGGSLEVSETSSELPSSSEPQP